MSDPVYNFDVRRAPKEKLRSWLSCYTVIVIGSHCYNWLCDTPYQALEPLAFDLPITCIRDWIPCCILSPQVKHLNTQGEPGCKLQLCPSLPTLTNQWHRLAVEETHIPSRGMCLSAINKWTVVTKSDLIVLLCRAPFESVLLSIRVSAGEGRIRFNAKRAVSLLHTLSSWIICQLPPPLLWICGTQYRWATGSNSPAWKPSLANYKLWLCSILWEALKSIPHRTDVWTDSWCQHADADLTSSQSVWLTSIHCN